MFLGFVVEGGVGFYVGVDICDVDVDVDIVVFECFE